MLRPRLALGLIAGAAMVGSHWLAYVLAAPDAHERAALLGSTGHGYWPLAAAFAVVAVFVGLAAFVGERLTPTARPSRGTVIGRVLPKLALLQVTGFVLVEITERVVAGHAIEAATFLAPTMFIGLLVQLAAALLSSLVLALVARVIARFVARPARARRAAKARTFVSLVSAPRPVPATGAHTLRGPPSLS